MNIVKLLKSIFSQTYVFDKNTCFFDVVWDGKEYLKGTFLDREDQFTGYILCRLDLVNQRYDMWVRSANSKNASVCRGMSLQYIKTTGLI